MPDAGATRALPDDLPALTADMVRQWGEAGLRALERHRSEIDGLNVYPVPDGDTGTNLHLTFEAAVRALDEADSARDGGGAVPDPARADAGAAVRALAAGALRGARGNSGTILAQLLLGAAEVLAPRDGPTGFDAERLGRALRRAADLGYRAVAAPVEGTVLSVVSAAAEAAEQAAGNPADRAGPPRGRTVTTVLAAIEAAERALLRTPEQLDVLGRAGVVDAGGRGVVVLLGALAETVVGRAFDPPAVLPVPGPASGAAGAAERGCGAGALGHHLRSGGPGYEVVYLLDAEEEAVSGLRARLAALGDSLVVVGGAGLWTVHVHVDDPGAAVEAGVEAGRPHRIRIEHFAAAAALPHGAADARHGADPAPGDPHPARSARSGRAVVAPAGGAGLAEVLAGAGATVPADPERVAAAVLDSAAAEAVLLPGGPDRWKPFLRAAEELEAHGVRARVVPSRSPVQTLAALAVHEPGAGLDDDTAAMSAAAAATDCALLVARDGAVHGVLGPDPAEPPAVTAPDAVQAGRRLLERMLADGGELVTLLPGADAPEGLAEALRAHVGTLRPEAETVVLPGGHPATLLTVGVE